MTPNTFEAYRINGKYDWVQFAAAYIAAIKPRNDNEFISMSEQAGAPPGRERGMITGGVRFTPSKALSFGAINYYVPDTWNIFYTEGNYTWPLTDKLGLKLQAQFTEQDSVGAGQPDRRIPDPSRGRSGVAQLRQRRAQGGVFHHGEVAEHQ